MFFMVFQKTSDSAVEAVRFALLFSVQNIELFRKGFSEPREDIDSDFVVLDDESRHTRKVQ